MVRDSARLACCSFGLYQFLSRRSGAHSRPHLDLVGGGARAEPEGQLGAGRRGKGVGAGRCLPGAVRHRGLAVEGAWLILDVSPALQTGRNATQMEQE